MGGREAPRKGLWSIRTKPHEKSQQPFDCYWRPPGTVWRRLLAICPKQDRPSGLDPRGHKGASFQCQCGLLPCLSLGAEPLIGAMGIFRLTCVGTGQGELEEKS